MWTTNIFDIVSFFKNTMQLCVPFVVDTDECSSSPCQNGATCSMPAFDMYKCECLVGYTGTNCETGNY